jgi:hypothetical protein
VGPTTTDPLLTVGLCSTSPTREGSTRCPCSTAS